MIAERYLSLKGYRIVGRRWCPSGWKRGELDLIALDGEQVVFVEVKTRRSVAYGRPEEAVDYRKRLQLRQMSYIWLRENRLLNRPYRIDVIAVVLTGGQAKVRHLTNAIVDA